MVVTNKQQCRKMCSEHQHEERRGIAEQGQHSCLQEVSLGACVAPVRPVDLQAPSSPCPGWVQRKTKAGSVPAPLASTPRLACLHGCLLPAPALQNEACKTERMGCTRKPSPQPNPLQHCASATHPSYLKSSLLQSSLTPITY